MCGIFGLVINNKLKINPSKLVFSIKYLAEKSQSRGKDSSGLSILNQKNNTLNIYKSPTPIKELINNSKVKNAIEKCFINSRRGCSYAFGHSRLVTNGSQLNFDNNQPIIKNNIIGIHNGIIVNSRELWRENIDLEKRLEVDTEVFLEIINQKILSENYSISSAISYALNNIEGTVAVALLLNDLNKIVLSTNNGSLYKIEKKNKILFFASEYFMLHKLAKKIKLNNLIGNYEIEQVEANSGYIYDLKDLSSSFFNTKTQKINYKKEIINSKSNRIKILDINPKGKQLSAVIDLNFIHLTTKARKEKKLLIYNFDEISKIKRCKKCILPKTFPFIFYDSIGVCNYCNNYKKSTKNQSIDELIKLVAPYRKINGSQDVLVPFSGGRDSTYTLHLAKTELGLNPITFTYDWGMVTDLARRNIARACGKLGVEKYYCSCKYSLEKKKYK
jgi:glutamine---fructose-6-phosphate transaminase (isomerizing)